MKKTVVFFTLLITCVVMFAQSGPTFPYQAVVRNSQNKLIKDSTFAVGVEVYQGATLKFSETQSVTTNANGQFTMNIGGGTVVSGSLSDIADWSVAKFKVTYHLSGGDIVSENAVSPVPYALQAANATSGNFLTSDSAVITTMQSDIATNRTDISTNATNIQTNTTNINNLILHTTQDALRDSVAGQIHDSIAPVAAKAHTHENKALLDTYTQTEANLAEAVAKRHEHANADILNNTTATYTDADSIKLKGIADGAEVNVQSDWEQTDGNQDDYIKNKPTIPTVPTNVSAFTNDAGYLTSNNEVITNLSQLLQQLTARLDAQNAKMDSLAQIVDSLSNLTPGGGDTPTEVADGQPCPGAATVSDGTNTYNTVKIGNQCWMAQNLRTNVGGGVYPKYPEDHTKAGQMVDDSLLYGRLYTWNAMMKGAPSTNYPAGTTEADTIVHGICPAGWHVPSDAEWSALTDYLETKPDQYKCGDDAENIANALSAATGWSSSGPCTPGDGQSTTSNKTGFSAVPAGGCYNHDFYDFGRTAYFWSATQDDEVGDDYALFRSLLSLGPIVATPTYEKVCGFSVRCLRDAGVGGGTTPSAPATMSCEQVMECMGDTLGKLNAKIEAQGAEIETLNGTVTSQGQTIETLNSTVESQGNTIDSLAHLVDSLSNLPHGGGDTPTEVADGQPCPGAATVSDGTNTYNTVKIGNQCWMAQNLRTNVGGSVYPKKNNGRDELSEDEKVTYGRLYTWNAMMKGAPSTNYPAGTTEADTIVQGICPTGWHVPSDAEWSALTDYLETKPDQYKCGDDTENIANALSAATGWSSSGPCTPGDGQSTTSNKTGFSAVPAGFCFFGDFGDFDDFDDFGNIAYFWSATQDDEVGDDYALFRSLLSHGPIVATPTYEKVCGFSVRCLRDAGIGGGDTPDTPGSGDTPTGSFTCGTDKVKDVDNNEYNTVQIGNQCWMKENLRTKTHQYGQVWTKTDVDSAIYGRYYDWQAAMQIEQGNSTSYTAGDKHRGICPEGWHVPSHAEWTQLTYYVNTAANGYRCNGDGTIAKALSSPTGWNSNTNEDCNAGNTGDKANATGFSAVPAGHCFDGNFASFGIHACFWSATQKTDYEAWYRYLDSSDSYVYSSSDYKENGFSVRCLRD